MMGEHERFWARLRIGELSDCWPCVSKPKQHGYAEVSSDGKRWRAHRLAWTLTFGPIPEDMQVCHHCDNRQCCNPFHLFLGTPLDNMRDMHAKGRFVLSRKAKGEANRLSKLTDESVRTIRLLAQGGLSQRAIASRFGVDHITIGKVVRRESWRHVE